MFEHFLRKTPNKEASPATARQARNTTEKYSLLFSFCARRISFSLNEKSIFLRCSAFQVFRQVAGLSTIWFRKEKAEFLPRRELALLRGAPNPPSAFSFLKRNGNGSNRAKIPSPQPPFFLPDCLGFAPKTFRRTELEAVPISLARRLRRLKKYHRNNQIYDRPKKVSEIKRIDRIKNNSNNYHYEHPLRILFFVVKVDRKWGRSKYNELKKLV